MLRYKGCVDDEARCRGSHVEKYQSPVPLGTREWDVER